MRLYYTGQLALSVQGSAGGLLIGGDANLYRDSADLLKTDDNFQCLQLRIYPPAAGNTAIKASQSGDTYDRLNITASGIISWGSGSASADVNLFRDAADRLATQDRFWITHPLSQGIYQSNNPALGIQFTSYTTNSVASEGIRFYSYFNRMYSNVLHFDMAYSSIAYAYYYNGSTYTDYSVELKEFGGSNIDLLTDTDDIFYFGRSASWDRLYFELSTYGVNVTLVWEYWDGDSWEAFSPTDGTSNLTASGWVTWNIGSLTGWTTTSVNGQSAYWIRIRTTTVPSTVPRSSQVNMSVFYGNFMSCSVHYLIKYTLDYLGNIRTAGRLYLGNSTQGEQYQNNYYLYQTGGTVGTNASFEVYGGVTFGMKSTVLSNIDNFMLYIPSDSTSQFLRCFKGSGEVFRITNSGVLLIGASQDVNLYRDAANVLRTDDRFLAYYSADVWGDIIGSGIFRGVHANTTAYLLSSYISASGTPEANPRFYIAMDGDIYWGAGGASAVDTNLYRNAANQLKTDDELIVAGNISTPSAFVVTGDGATKDATYIPYATDGSIYLSTIANARVDFRHGWSPVVTAFRFDMATNTITIGGDVVLYRYTADVLASQDEFRIIRATSGDWTHTAMIISDTVPRLVINAGGTIWFSDGSSFDTNLYRSGANTLETADNFVVQLDLWLQIGKNINISGSTGGTAGSNLGFINFVDTYFSGQRILAEKGIYDSDTKYKWQWYYWNGTGWGLRATLTEDGKFILPVDGSSGGLLIGSDVSLYRYGANVLKISQALRVGAGTNGMLLQSSADDNLYIMTHTNTPNPNISIGYGNGSGSIDSTKENIYLNAGLIYLNNMDVRILSAQPKIYMWDGGQTYPAGIATEVDNQLLDYGANYAQLGSRDTAKRGGFFRIDLRDAYTGEFFTVFDIEPSSAEVKLMGLSTGGQLALPIVGSGGGILLGGDVALYRHASVADLLRIGQGDRIEMGDAAPDTDSYAVFGITRPNDSAQYSYIGLTKSGVVPWGIGVQGGVGLSDFIIGQATSSPARTIPTPLIQLNTLGDMTLYRNMYVGAIAAGGDYDPFIALFACGGASYFIQYIQSLYDSEAILLNPYKHLIYKPQISGTQKFSIMDSAGNENAYINTAGRIKAGHIHLTEAWQGAATATDSEISNDVGTYKCLMIVGNSSGGGGTRRVQVWDEFTVNGNEFVTGTLKAGGYQSSDGTAGATTSQTFSYITYWDGYTLNWSDYTITVKNGLVTSIA
jgi:hypothetical protein